MNCVNWHGAKAYCAFVGARLPTEDEWYAEASNGGRRKYPWGSQKANCVRSVMKEGGSGCRQNRTWPVCSKPLGNSVSGLCDLSGNVWEWTTTKQSGGRRVIRGGSWYNDAPSIKASARAYPNSSGAAFDFGFRCVSKEQVRPDAASPKINIPKPTSKKKVRGTKKSTSSITCDEILTLVQLRVPKSEIIKAMEKSGPSSLAANTVKCLKKGGAPRSIVRVAKELWR